MTKMAAMPIYCKDLRKSSSPEPADRFSCNWGHDAGHMTKMAAMPIYGKNPLEIFFSRTCRPISTGQGKVREIFFFFKVREKSGNFEKWSGKLENLKKSGKSQGILKLWFVQTKKINK